MHRKIISIISLLLITLVVFTSCGGSSVAREFKVPDKVPVVLPDSLLPAGEKAHYEDSNKSSAYFESNMSVDEVKQFYEKAFTDMGVHDIKELNEQDLLDNKLIPEPAEDNTGNIVWAYYGNYTPLAIEVPSTDKTPASTTGEEVQVEPGI